MIKKKYTNITLDCILQCNEISETECPSGVISRTADGTFRFEEEIRKPRAPRNPRLYDGRFISMVRQRDGRYRLHLKNIDAQKTDLTNYAFSVYMELSGAVELMAAKESNPLPPIE